MKRGGLINACVVAASITAATVCAATPAQAVERKLSIEVLSNRADLISGGDALVSIDLPDGTAPHDVTVRLNGSDVTSQFATRTDGRFEALLTGLEPGSNALVATGAGQRDTVTIVNHGNGGPVISGPQLQPWVCQSTAVDKQCNQPATYDFWYMPTTVPPNEVAKFQPYDPSDPPPAEAIATTTTDQGKTVPFIVRREIGYQDRDQYASAVLFDPADRDKPSLPWSPPPGFNHTMLVAHGAQCGVEYRPGTATDVLAEDPESLGRGMVVMATALDNAGHNCNVASEAESVIMAKEHVIEEYGPLRYTIGEGSSGGSIASQTIANAYPGVYQGLIVDNSFPDAGSSGGIQLFDDRLLDLYLENSAAWGPGVVWDPLSIDAVLGTPNTANSLVFDVVFWPLFNPSRVCAGETQAQAYDASANPAGTRCTLPDALINVLGPRRADDWGPVEKKIGRGFAGTPYDNVGIPYGLDALMAGQITPAQFTDLNAKIGGFDHDFLPTPERLRADPDAVANAYRSGFVNMTNNDAVLPTIDFRQVDFGGIHDGYRAWATRARMTREQGHDPRNHVIESTSVTFHAPTASGEHERGLGIPMMVRWLNAVEADHRDVPLEQKVSEDRPADVHDRCTSADLESTNLPGVGEVCRSKFARTSFNTIRGAAGGPYSNDTLKCQLKPLRRADFLPIAFTDNQWATLEKAFPTGICDWSKPGVSQTGTIPWQTYQDADGNVVYGGRPLGPAPAGSGTGWTGPSFSSWRDAIPGGTSGAAEREAAAKTSTSVNPTS